jgi:hypothetical protein
MALTAKQKKLPKALQKSILAKQKKGMGKKKKKKGGKKKKKGKEDEFMDDKTLVT